MTEPKTAVPGAGRRVLLHRLARDLGGFLVADLEARMTEAELQSWAVFLEAEAAAAAHFRRKAEREAKTAQSSGSRRR